MYKEEILNAFEEVDSCLHDEIIDVLHEIDEYKDKDIKVPIELYDKEAKLQLVKSEALSLCKKINAVDF